jgi:hypothetical protein
MSNINFSVLDDRRPTIRAAANKAELLNRSLPNTIISCKCGSLIHLYEMTEGRDRISFVLAYWLKQFPWWGESGIPSEPA